MEPVPEKALEPDGPLAKSERRGVSDVHVMAPRVKGAPHPFGVRNRLLCEARKLARQGHIVAANRQAEEANCIAALTSLERQNVDQQYHLYLEARKTP
jgi:hypothetical protein